MARLVRRREIVEDYSSNQVRKYNAHTKNRPCAGAQVPPCDPVGTPMYRSEGACPWRTPRGVPPLPLDSSLTPHAWNHCDSPRRPPTRSRRIEVSPYAWLRAHRCADRESAMCRKSYPYGTLLSTADTGITRIAFMKMYVCIVSGPVSSYLGRALVELSVLHRGSLTDVVRNRTLRISHVRNRTLRISKVRNRTLRISHPGHYGARHSQQRVSGAVFHGEFTEDY